MPAIPISLSIDGQQFQDLSRRFRQAADVDLGRELDFALTQVAQSLPQSLRASAVATLPRRGGLGALVARSSVSEPDRSTAGTVTIEVAVSSPNDLAGIDAGQVRHPLFGDRRHWFTQRVTPGWWSVPVSATESKARDAVTNAIDTVTRGI